MTAPSPLVERVAVAMWDTWNRVMVEYGLHKQSNGGFYDPEPTDDPIKAEAHRLLRKAALDEAHAALAACHAEEMMEALRDVAETAEVLCEGYSSHNQEAMSVWNAKALLARLDGKPTEQPA